MYIYFILNYISILWMMFSKKKLLIFQVHKKHDPYKFENAILIMAIKHVVIYIFYANIVQ